MRVAVVQFWDVSPHLETSFEISSAHLEAGDEVEYFCGGHAPFIEHGSSSNLSLHFRSQYKVDRAAILLKRNTGYGLEVKRDWLKLEYTLIRLKGSVTRESISDFQHEDFGVGRAALSSLMQIKRTAFEEQDLTSYRDILSEIISSGIHVYNSILPVLDNNKFDRVYVFNGRFVNDAAVVAVCRKLGLEVYFHERGATLDKYSLVNYLVHDRKKVQQTILDFWDKSEFDTEMKIQIAKNWFEQSIGGDQVGSWLSFSREFDRTLDLQRALKAEGITLYERYWVFFQSSDDEYASVEKSLITPTQWSGQRELVLAVYACIPDGIQLVVRIHPNMAHKSEDIALWREVAKNFPSIVFIMHDSTINSYELAKSAEFVITCGSTIGVESLYLRKSVICCGDSFYNFCRGVISVYTYHELREALVHEPQAVDTIDAIKVGFFRAEFGVPYKYYEPSSILSGTFFGHDLSNCSYIV